MKTTSQSAARSTVSRKFGILDTLVLMLAVSLFGVWILGTLYLSIFPSVANTNGDSQTAALIDDVEDNSSTSSAALAPQGSDDGTSAANSASEPNRSQASEVNFTTNQPKASSDLTSEEKTALEQKISTLQEQLETKSEELTKLRNTSKKLADSKPKVAVDTTKYKNEIAQLTKQKSQLDREVKKLKDLTNTQKTKIQSLQDQLVAKPVTAEASAADAKDNGPAISGAPPQTQPLEFRDWISSKGNKARLAFVRWEGEGIVVVNEASKKFRLTLDRLSPKDQEYVNSKR